MGWLGFIGLLGWLGLATPARSQATAPSPGSRVPDWSLEARQRLIGGPMTGARSQELAQRAVLLQQGEALLAAGDAAAAEQAFDAAALLLHAPDTETSLVRSYLQAGDYRRALAFAAHAAGAHREMPAASALYAWLLHAGGQPAVARQRLDDALAAAPGQRALEAARNQLASVAPMAPEALMQAPARLAPYAVGASPVHGSSVVASGLLIDGGREALVPAAALAGASSVWLRNGLGQTSAATLVQLHDGLGVARLRLTQPLAWPNAQRAAARDPFAGSPGTTVEFTPSAAAQPAWPLLHHGFVGRQVNEGVPRPLGIGVPAGLHGGPVFNAAGSLAGIALAAPDGSASLLGLVALRPALGEVFGPPEGLAPGSAGSGPAAAAAPPRAALDEIYERALRLSLQLIKAPPAR